MKTRRYGCWAGNPAGMAERKTDCIEEVHDGSRGGLFHQCQRKRGFGPDGLYCKRHDPEAVTARKEKSDAAYNIKWRKQMLEAYGPGAVWVLARIARGHNDPMTLAREYMEMMGEYAPTDAELTAAVSRINPERKEG